MATITRYKSASDDGGATGSQISNGVAENLFSSLTVTERLTGDLELRKMWVESDVDIPDAYIGLQDQGYYKCRVFQSAGTNDTVADLTGNETRFGSAKLTGTQAAASIRIETPDPTITIFRVNDYAHINGEITQITAITDNGDGTTSIDVSPSFSTVPAVGSTFNSLIQTSLTANTPAPFWLEADVPANSPRPSGYDNIVTVVLY